MRKNIVLHIIYFPCLETDPFCSSLNSCSLLVLDDIIIVLKLSVCPLQKVTGYFDTSVGDKSAKDSYAAIAKQVEANVEEVLYLTSHAAGNASNLSYHTKFSVVCILFRFAWSPLVTSQ